MPEFPRREGDIMDFGPNYGPGSLLGQQRYDPISASHLWLMDLFSRHPRIFQSILDFYSKSPSQVSVSPQSSEPTKMLTEPTVPPQTVPYRESDPMIDDYQNTRPRYF